MDPSALLSIPTNLKETFTALYQVLNQKDFVALRSFVEDLMQQNHELRSKNLELQKQTDANREWEKTKSEWKRHKTEVGDWVYVSTTVSDLYGCPCCFDKRQISFLQVWNSEAKVCRECQAVNLSSALYRFSREKRLRGVRPLDGPPY